MQNLLSLPAELTIYSVAELHPSWLAALRDAFGDADRANAVAPDVRVGAADVAEVDAAGMQLLISLSNTIAMRGCKLQLVGPSPALVAAGAALGVDYLFANADCGGARK